MRFSKFIRWVLYIIGGLIGAILLSLIVLIFIPITVDLTPYKGEVESAATLALGRTVKVDDKIVVTTRIQPYFSIKGLRIANPKGFQSGDFLQMKNAKFGVRVIPLLTGKIHITEIKVKGLSVLLVENEKGAVNWASSMPAQSTSDAPPPAQIPWEKRRIKLETDSLVLTNVVLEDISIDYRRPGVIKPIQFKIEECTGAMRVGKPLTLAMKGSLLKVPHKTTIEIGSLEELLEKNKSHMNITMKTPINRLELSGVIDLAQVSKNLALKAAFAGERLDSLNRFFNIDLPPLKSYRAEANLNLRKKRADLTQLTIQVGQSKLTGKMTVDTSGARPKSTIELSAPLIQLEDFDVGNWSQEKSHSELPIVENEKESGTKALKAGPHSSAEKLGKLLSPELLGKFDVKMIVKVKKVLSGSAELGSSSVTTILKGGRFSIIAAVAGDRLDSLNRLFNIDLPPLKSYRAEAHLNLRKKRADFSKFNIQVGQSKLTGKMTIDNSGARPKSTIELSAPLIQLNDFDVGNWSPEKGHSEQPVVKNEKKKESNSPAPKGKHYAFQEKAKKILSSEVVGKFDVKMIVKVNKVLSGSDELGSGSLTTTLKQGRFSIDPLKLNIPGGSLTLAASLKPDKKAGEASLRILMKKFDFGILVRRANPKAKMGGRINLDVDLKSNANSFKTLIPNSNGYIDFSGRLENLEAGVIDLWAVNLIAAILSRDDTNESEINCVVGRWTMKNGLLKPDLFLIDTSKIRICGKGQVDFRKNHIEMKMAPTPKKPEYFSLATPIEIDGNFDIDGNFSEYDPDIQAGGLIGTTVKFIAGPVMTTFKRLFSKELPVDGSDVCAMPIGPENRSAKRPAGCKY